MHFGLSLVVDGPVAAVNLVLQEALAGEVVVRGIAPSHELVATAARRDF